MKYIKFLFIFILNLALISCIKSSSVNSNRPVTELKYTSSGSIHPVAGQLKAYNMRDASMFAKWFANEVLVFNFGDPNPVITSRKELKKRYAIMFSKAKELHCEVVRRIVTGNFVIDEEIVKGIPGKGTVHATAIYEVLNGKIVKVWFIKE
ncbi:MAG: nuclear transport factor 2 family protein [Deltaproteobacteria bacterium]|nr:nuclear transport factor 2 family protein [Deltaproteobacteria bacterium]